MYISLALLVIFVVSRLLLIKAGVIFYGSFVHRMWQLIDIQVLQTHLWQSLWYDHAQPPLFNLVTGVVVNLFPIQHIFVLRGLQAGVSLATLLLLYHTMVKLSRSRYVAFGITLYLMLSPSWILYENLYSYTLLTLLVLTGVVYGLVWLIHDEDPRAARLVSFALLAAVMLRSSFHLLWMIILLGALWWMYRQHARLRRALLLSAIIPLFIACGWYLKNAVLFGHFTSSTWMGMSLARIVPVGEPAPFLPLHQYASWLTPDDTSAYPNVPLLHERYKHTRRWVNYHHLGYIRVSDRFRQAAIDTIVSHPHQYATRVGQAFVIYGSPATHAPFMSQNYAHLPYAPWYTLDFSSFKRYDVRAFTVWQAAPMLILHGLLLVMGIWGSMARPAPIYIRRLCIVLTMMFAYGMLVSNLLEYGENNRFRFEGLPLFICLMLMVPLIWKHVIKKSFSKT